MLCNFSEADAENRQQSVTLMMNLNKASRSVVSINLCFMQDQSYQSRTLRFKLILNMKINYTD